MSGDITRFYTSLLPMLMAAVEGRGNDSLRLGCLTPLSLPVTTVSRETLNERGNEP